MPTIYGGISVSGGKITTADIELTSGGIYGPGWWSLNLCTQPCTHTTPGLLAELTYITDAGITDIVSYGLYIPAPVPLPAALPLFATGLGVLGLLGWRRRRKAARSPTASAPEPKETSLA